MVLRMIPLGSYSKWQHRTILSGVGLLLALSIRAQVSISIGSLESCPLNQALVPVNGTNLTNVAALTLSISFNPEHLAFVSLANPHPQLGSGPLLANASSGPNPAITIVWQSLAGMSIPAGKLFDLKLQYLDGESNLSFQPAGCEIVDVNLTEFTGVNYGAGWIGPEYMIMDQPGSLLLDLGQTAVFTVDASLSGLNHQWQRNDGSGWADLAEGSAFTGTQSWSLSFVPGSMEMNGHWFRCKLQSTDCVMFSDSAQLQLNLVTQQFVPDSQGFPFELFYEPGAGLIHYRLLRDCPGCRIEGFGISGNQVVSIPEPGQSGWLGKAGLHSNMVIVRLVKEETLLDSRILLIP